MARFLSAWLTLLCGPLLAAPPAANPARLMGELRHAITAFSPRDFAHPENLARAAVWVGDRLRAAGGKVTEQPFQVNGARYLNVSGRFGPEKGPRLVLGAHLDTFRGLPGGDDNTSGVAVLLELARLLGAAAPPIPVELAFYPNEEPPAFRTPAMGSCRHAQSLRSAGSKVLAMVSVDMVGDFTDGTRVTKPFQQIRANTLAVVADDAHADTALQLKTLLAPRLPGLKVVEVVAPRAVPGIDWSDHLSFWDAGFPAVMLTSGGGFRATAYHTPQDLPERLDAGRMGELAQALWWLCQDLR